MLLYPVSNLLWRNIHPCYFGIWNLIFRYYRSTNISCQYWAREGETFKYLTLTQLWDFMDQPMLRCQNWTSAGETFVHFLCQLKVDSNLGILAVGYYFVAISEPQGVKYSCNAIWNFVQPWSIIDQLILHCQYWTRTEPFINRALIFKSWTNFGILSVSQCFVASIEPTQGKYSYTVSWHFELGSRSG